MRLLTKTHVAKTAASQDERLLRNVEVQAAIAAEPLNVSDPQAPDHAALRAPPLAAKTDNPLNDSGQEHGDREKTTPTA